MKISKYILIGSLAVMSTGLASCGSDWLEITSNTQDFIEDYYTNQENIFQAVVAAYDPMHWFDYANNYAGLNIEPEVVSDQCYPGGGDINDMSQYKHMFNFTLTGTNLLDSNYSNAYSGVKRCNDAIHYMFDFWNPTSSEDLALRDRYESECIALRVFFYNNLWHYWGNIVYYDKNLSGDFLGTQYTHDEVYDFMVKDLEYVIEKDVLPEKITNPADLGRLTKHFVYMLYAEIVMYQNDTTRYATALNYMEEIINSGKYKLMDDFASIWTLENEWCDESIYEINYSDYGGNRDWSWGGTCGGTVVPAMILPRNYDTRDGIHDNTGWGFCTVRKSCYDSFDGNDKRRDASIWAPDADSYQHGYQDTGLFLAKYAGLVGGNSLANGAKALNYNNNLRLYRYSEALLNAAELGSSKKQQYLDMVRGRAGLGSVVATEQTIFDERGWEFLGEGKRYWDIIRTGRASTLLVPDDEIPGEGRQGRWTDNKKYIPFPQSEIDQAHGTLKQNDEYFL